MEVAGFIQRVQDRSVNARQTEFQNMGLVVINPDNSVKMIH
jgi:hypothetical protein